MKRCSCTVWGRRLELNTKEKQDLLVLARNTLKHAFGPAPEKVLEDFRNNREVLTPALKDSLSCFVTLYSKGGRLRGCIGSLIALAPLYENVHHSTLNAAFKDPRFQPVEQSEISALAISISVLGSTEPLPSLKDLKIGRHGLTVRKGNHHGVLLASVAVKYRWSAQEFLEQTCIKAGLEPENAHEYNVSYFDEISFEEPKISRL